MTNGIELRESFILRLFDTIKDSNINVVNTLSKQTDALDTLGDVVKEGVQNEELKKLIEKHSTESESKISKLFSRVNIMIACVSIAFGISAISYFVVRSSVDNMINKRLEEHSITMTADDIIRDDNHEDLENKIEEILKLIKTLHKEDEKYGPTK